MSKFYPNVQRRDSLVDHAHHCPDGAITQGALNKPQKDRYGWHTHLYTLEGRVHESGPANDEPGHIHVTELGDTSAPIPVPKAMGEFVSRTDSNDDGDYISRRGREWFVVNAQGAPLSRHSNRFDAEDALRQIDAFQKRA